MGKFSSLGGVGILGFISPEHTNDTYAVIDPIYGIDGLRNVGSIEELLNITFERRRPGMIVGVGGGDSYFKLKNSQWKFDLTDWLEVELDKVHHSDKESPSGDINGDNAVFQLQYTPIPNSEHLFVNGILQDSGVDNDYQISGNTITFLIPPREGFKIKCSYRYKNL